MGPPLCHTQKRHFLALALVQSGERIPGMYFWITAEHCLTDQTLLSVLAVRMWSYLTRILTKSESLTVPVSNELN